MSIEMEHARKLVELENQAKAAVAELGKISSELTRMGKDLKLNGWDWNKSSSVVYLMPQGRVGVEIVDISNRP